MSLQNQLELNALIYEGEGYDVHFERHFPYDFSEVEKQYQELVPAFKRLPKAEQLKYARWMYLLENGPVFQETSTNQETWVHKDVQEIKLELHTRFAAVDVVIYKPWGRVTPQAIEKIEEYKNLRLPIAHIYTFLINPFLTGQGYGKRAFQKLEEFLKKHHGVNEIFLQPLVRGKMTDEEGLGPTLFWQKLGFEFPKGQKLLELPKVERGISGVSNEPTMTIKAPGNRTLARHMWKTTEAKYTPEDDVFDKEYVFQPKVKASLYFFREEDPTFMIERTAFPNTWPLSELVHLIQYQHPTVVRGVDTVRDSRNREPLRSRARSRTRTQTQHRPFPRYAERQPGRELSRPQRIRPKREERDDSERLERPARKAKKPTRKPVIDLTGPEPPLIDLTGPKAPVIDLTGPEVIDLTGPEVIEIE